MWKRLLFSVLLFAGSVWVTADALFGLTQAGGQTVTVPDLIGCRAEEAERYEWLDATVEYRYDKQTPAGIVMEQKPTPGSTRKLNERQKTCPITLTVSLGSERLTVPDLVGEDARTAVTALRNAGFLVREETAAGGKAGTILATDPPAGSVLEAGETVKVTVGAGERSDTVAVPDVLGMPRTEALFQIYLRGFTVSGVTEEISEQSPGTVIRVSPEPGSFLPKGSALRVVVAKEATAHETNGEPNGHGELPDE